MSTGYIEYRGILIVHLTDYCYKCQDNKDEMGGACSEHGEIRNAYKMLIGTPEGKKAFGRPRHICECNIKTDAKLVRKVDVTIVARDGDRWRWLLWTR
jgi:hypothetical protein